MERNNGESFEAYKKRRSEANRELKEKLKPRLIWNNGTKIGSFKPEVKIWS